MAHCCVPSCNNNWRYKDDYEREHGKKLSFHEFPSSLHRRKAWIVKIRRDEGKFFKVTRRTYICSAHFKTDDYIRTLTGMNKLKKDVDPSVFAWTEEKPKRRSPKKRENLNATASSSRKKKKKDKSKKSEAETSHCQDAEKKLPADKSNCNSEDIIHEYDHDYATKACTVEEQLKAAQAQVVKLEEMLKKQSVERFGLHRFMNDPDMIKFYTGFTSYALLKTFYESIAPHAASMVKWSQYKQFSTNRTKRMRSGFMCKLSLIDQLFMFLHKARLGSLDQDLADKFYVSQSTVSRNTVTWANFLYCLLGSQPWWPSRENVQKYMPPTMKKLYPNARVILDCTELRVQRPSSLVLNSEMYSQYKGATTMKCLIGCTPLGAISFVSSLYSGSISDKHITQVSGVLDLLEEGDSVMVDKGFLIGDMLKEKGCALIIPNFLSNKGQFSKEESSENQVIANLRVHVERAIKRIREYHMFDTAVPLTLAGTINQLWTVCCLLTNFQGPLIKNPK